VPNPLPRTCQILYPNASNPLSKTRYSLYPPCAKLLAFSDRIIQNVEYAIKWLNGEILQESIDVAVLKK
jgi:hypothetical protein